jgi:WD40 repeat protein
MRIARRDGHAGHASGCSGEPAPGLHPTTRLSGRRGWAMVWLVVFLFAGLTGCLGSLPLIGRDPVPKSTPPSSRVQTTSGELPTAPQLRLETGMHTAAITHIGVDAGNRYLVTGSHDKTIRVWELETGRLLCARPLAQAVRARSMPWPSLPMATPLLPVAG